MQANDPNAGPIKLESMTYVEEAIDQEVKQIRVQQREQRVRSLTDVTLMLLTILITILVATYVL